MPYKPRRVLNAEELESWPLYSSLMDWARVLDCSPDTLRNGMRDRLLISSRVGNRHFFTKSQILKWYAPALHKIMYDTEYYQPIAVGKEMR
jgi:hypothetical protein